MWIQIEKNRRLLRLMEGEREAYRCRVGLGRCPVGPKEAEGDGRTPEGVYFICLVKEKGKYGRSLGLSYPGPEDAQRALAQGRIDRRTFESVRLAHAQRRRPPWGSPLGGEIYLHEGGGDRDWTQGCIALDARDMDAVFAAWPRVERVVILP